MGVVGGPVNPFKPVSVLVLVDIDKPSALDKYPGLKSIVESTVSWYTGPRCPKCEEKHLEVLEPGVKFKCSKCDVEFTLSEAKRGVAALVTVDSSTAEKYIPGTVRGGDVELLLNNYQLIPPSLHPSGVKYEWIKPFDFEAPNLGVRALVDSEVVSLLEELGVLKPETTRTEERTEKSASTIVAETQEKTVRTTVTLRKLGDSEILEVKELLKPFYVPEHRQKLCLYLAGHGAYSKIHPVSKNRVQRTLGITLRELLRGV